MSEAEAQPKGQDVVKEEDLDPKLKQLYLRGVSALELRNWGYVISLFQAVTQIQEQTLPQTIKIFVIALVLLTSGTMLAAPLYSLSEDIFTNFYKDDVGS